MAILKEKKTWTRERTRKRYVSIDRLSKTEAENVRKALRFLATSRTVTALAASLGMSRKALHRALEKDGRASAGLSRRALLQGRFLQSSTLKTAQRAFFVCRNSRLLSRRSADTREVSYKKYLTNHSYCHTKTRPMANYLSRDKQISVVSALVEGCSIRSTSRMTGVNRGTIEKLLVSVGDGCADLMSRSMVNLPCECLELDELWAFVGKKQRHVTKNDDRRRVGDQWTWVAVDADTKLVPAFLVGKRDHATANAFIRDLAPRLRNRVQISTDGLAAYVAPIAREFATTGVDYAQIHKEYEAEPIGPGRYSPPKVISTEKTPVMGEPVEEWVSTSYVERQNLTVRMGVRRYTRLTNAFSKKLENHIAATALHFAHYNFVRVHKTLRVTPAMAAGISGTLWTVADLLNATLGAAKK